MTWLPQVPEKHVAVFRAPVETVPVPKGYLARIRGCDSGAAIQLNRRVGVAERAGQCVLGGGELMVPQEGFEPPTPSLRMRCSTN
jgi:hypothetical protein